MNVTVRLVLKTSWCYNLEDKPSSSNRLQEIHMYIKGRDSNWTQLKMETSSILSRVKTIHFFTININFGSYWIYSQPQIEPKQYIILHNEIHFHVIWKSGIPRIKICQFDYVNSSQIDKRNFESGRAASSMTIVLGINREDNVLTRRSKYLVM